ncbi:MAG: hypothetical protein A2W31_12755 [Planctomycetes bacterium RBG_16_64_10]|nr:MAG: hypothetical protein A2W31_12755 [Planctomycetes bacterium RBG_16_64_10]
MAAVSAGAAVAAATGTRADQAGPNGGHLANRQGDPLPELGSHWETTFQGLSAACRSPGMSFLNDEFADPAAWCERARATLLANFHYAPPPCDHRPQIEDEADCGTYVRQRVRINTTPDIRIPVYVLVPKDLRQPAPAIVALHDHGGFYFWGKEKLVTVAPEHPELTAFKRQAYGGQSVADALAKRGFVVIAADMLHWGERGMYLAGDPARIKERTAAVTKEDIRRFNARSWEHEELIGRVALVCGVTWSGIIAWDDLRVTDYLLTRPEVDRDRVGCVGLSVGAVRTIFLGALHPAVKASVAVCWMAEYPPMARSHVYYKIGFSKLVPGLYRDLDWPDLAGLHWPGTLMTINGLKDELYPLEAAQGAIDKVRRIFAKAGSPEHYEAVFFDGPHEFNLAMQQRAFDWLSRALGVA